MNESRGLDNAMQEREKAVWRIPDIAQSSNPIA